MYLMLSFKIYYFFLLFFFCCLKQHAQLSFKINPHHDRLVSILATEVLKAPQSAEAKLYLRMIFQLRPSTENIKIHKELLTLIDSMSKVSFSLFTNLLLINI